MCTLCTALPKGMFTPGPSTPCEAVQTQEGHHSRAASRKSCLHHKTPSLSSRSKNQAGRLVFQYFSLSKSQSADFSGAAQLSLRLALLLSVYSVPECCCHVHPERSTEQLLWFVGLLISLRKAPQEDMSVHSPIF